jgi:parallel beta-helix repeat protein
MRRKWLTVGIILLLVGISYAPAIAQITEKPSVSRGTWLYVGGSGPGNYTKIQDAIDNASNGDTVFVFDESSPYIENILINTSVSLIGENKETTIINGSTNGSGQNMTDYFGVWINADNVTVRGFTIQGCNLSAIYILSNYTNITDTILSHNRAYGILLGSTEPSPSPEMSGFHTITNNLIIHNTIGIWVQSQNNIIRGNVISYNDVGIIVLLSMNNNISHNRISQATTGVLLTGSYKTVMYRNNITNNDKGVYTMWTSADRILQNNFIDNNQSASAAQGRLFLMIYRLKGEIPFPVRRNVWNQNYWDRPRLLPYKSPGVLMFFIDWHPAKEPYDI